MTHPQPSDDVVTRAKDVAARLRAPTATGYQYREKDEGAAVIDELIAEIERLRAFSNR